MDGTDAQHDRADEDEQDREEPREVVGFAEDDALLQGGKVGADDTPTQGGRDVPRAREVDQAADSVEEAERE